MKHSVISEDMLTTRERIYSCSDIQFQVRALLAFRKTTHSIDMLCMQVETPSEGSPPPHIKDFKLCLGFDWFPLKWHIMAFRFK